MLIDSVFCVDSRHFNFSACKKRKQLHTTYMRDLLSNGGLISQHLRINLAKCANRTQDPNHP
jgi:hypothetical protein